MAGLTDENLRLTSLLMRDAAERAAAKIKLAEDDFPPFGLVPIPVSGVSLDLQGFVQRAERDVLRISGISASYLGQDALIAELQAEVARMKTAHAAAYAVDFQRCQEIARLRTEVESLRVERDEARARLVQANQPTAVPEPAAPPIFNAIKAHR